MRGASFQVPRGQTLGIVGESGSGKSVSAQALIGLVPGADVTGEAWFEGRDLLAMTGQQLRDIRGKRISMVFQDPLTSLHPLHKLGWQLTEAIRAHDSASGAARPLTARPSTCWAWSTGRPSGSTTTRTSSPAACGSGS